MSTNKTWPSGTGNASPTAYSIPSVGDLNWASLSDFLIALADNAQSTTGQRMAFQIMLTSPYTASDSDCIIISDLTVAGAVAISLPAVTYKQIIFIKDGKGDAGTPGNEVTITPDGAETIDGQANLVLSDNNNYVMLIGDSDNSNWRTVIKGSYT